MLFSRTHTFAILAALSAAANAYTVYHSNGKECRGQGLGKTDNLKSTSGCQLAWAGKAASIRIEPEKDDKDVGTVVVFFEGDDCNPTKIMQNGDAFSDEGCTTINYGSYEVWELWRVDGMSAP
ncbi:hypothetical protein IQ06DRAFT_352176 [Phaeosphaeriaceae sp. SRC1lsM3a]|nr:hypothetical protein IQ06DRAFT_352176 [Stagonospora sp. SRC1lsM3a]